MPIETRAGKKRWEEGYGQGEASIALDDDVLIDDVALRERLLETFHAAGYQPPTLPATATRLLAMSQDPEINLDDVIAVLEADQMIAGRVLKIANSAHCAGAAQIDSLRGALMRLGMNTLRDLVLEVAMNLRVFRSDAYSAPMERVRIHSQATAHLCRIVSKFTSIDGEYAFLCGLLHDVGVAGVLVALAEGARGHEPPDLQVLWPAIDGVHAEAGEIMTRLWELPPDVSMVVGAHHRVEIQGFPHPLAATVCLADQLATSHGAGLRPSEPSGEDVGMYAEVDSTGPATVERARSALSISDASWGLIEAESDAWLQELGDTSLSAPPHPGS